jgi:NDP-sugar pyrophosphorylase family protein
MRPKILGDNDYVIVAGDACLSFDINGILKKHVNRKVKYII